MSVTAAPGFVAAGVAAGIKASGNPDLSLVATADGKPVAAAGVFTRNKMTAAPVITTRAHLEATAGHAVAVVLNSGNANAATGQQGLDDAEAMCEAVASALGIESQQVLVCSTGLIGIPMPIDVITAGIPSVVAARSADGGQAAATAIMTTDTRVKVSTRRLENARGAITLTGLAKGAAMIGPNMATMLACVVTDAPVDPAHLKTALTRAVDRSFHCVLVEGHTSTNDTVFVLANGLAWPADAGPVDAATLEAFDQALEEVCRDLARAIAEDAEGAGHLVVLEVRGTADEQSARTVARRVAESPLVKTAVHGADPNWGRVVSAAGYAGVPFNEADMSLEIDGIPLFRAGEPVDFDARAVSAHMRNNRRLTFTLTLGSGPGQCTFYTCDMTEEYIRLNADYTT